MTNIGMGVGGSRECKEMVDMNKRENEKKGGMWFYFFKRKAAYEM